MNIPIHLRGHNEANVPVSSGSTGAEQRHRLELFPDRWRERSRPHGLHHWNAGAYAPEQLAEFLLKRGVKGIKIYPYDRGPVNGMARHGGTFITQAELKQSLDPIQPYPPGRR